MGNVDDPVAHPPGTAKFTASGGSAKTLRVGLIGLGAIGRSLIDLIERDLASPLVVVGVLVRDVVRHKGDGVQVVGSLAELMELEPNIVAEAAGHSAVREWGPACLRASIPLVMLSIGALADRALEEELRSSAIEGDTRLELPSGGVGGLDVIASAANGGIDRVLHTIVKPPRALGVNVDSRTVIFSGTAREAAAQFPQNANVAAAVALAGVGLDRSQVMIVADPEATTNRSELDASGAFGRATVVIDNKPSQSNPRTAAIVAMSLKHALEKHCDPIVIG